jgi:hypothetical protein
MASGQERLHTLHTFGLVDEDAGLLDPTERRRSISTTPLCAAGIMIVLGGVVLR